MSSQKAANSSIFIDLFTEIEQKLRDEYDERYYAGFAEMIRKVKNTNPIVKTYYADLQEYAQLRNAIVHTRRENFVIAEPHDEVVQQIRRIRNLLMNPPRLSQVMTKNPYISKPEDPIQLMLQAFAERDIMRSPVVDNGKIVGLITSRTIAKWLIFHKDALHLQSLKVADLLPYANNNDFVVVSENLDIFSLAGMFKNSISQGKYLQAALITSNGRPENPLTGIITPADVPYLIEKR
jgi:predicted transcriptional regulator